MPRSECPSKFTLRVDRKILKEVYKNPKTSSWDLQQPFVTVDVKVCAQVELAWEVWNLGSLRQTRFARDNIDKDQDL